MMDPVERLTKVRDGFKSDMHRMKEGHLSTRNGRYRDIAPQLQSTNIPHAVFEITFQTIISDEMWETGKRGNAPSHGEDRRLAFPWNAKLRQRTLPRSKSLQQPALTAEFVLNAMRAQRMPDRGDVDRNDGFAELLFQRREDVERG
jgi:hypothetical protein